jgi:glycosyltransferase involved in cell wall biosynthesis
MPHITVTIPVYNRAHLVGRTIESVLSQDFDDWDLLVVDDGSTDNTVEVVQEYCQRDGRVHLEVNPMNLGLTRNWNRCLEMARGPLVQILQSDDLIDHNYLQMVSDMFETHPSLGFVAASCRYIDANDQVINPGTPLPAKYYQAGDEAVTGFLTQLLPHVSSIVMKRECYEAVGKFDPAIWHGPDVEMDARLAAHYDFFHFGSVHSSFRRHGTNIAHLEFLREDFLDVDMYKKRKAWGYLSLAGQRQLDIIDLERNLARNTATTAYNGAVMTLAFGRSRLSRYYVRQAVKYDRRMWRTSRWWMVAALALIPSVGQRVMERRLHLNSTDQDVANVIESSLSAIGPA